MEDWDWEGSSTDLHQKPHFFTPGSTPDRADGSTDSNDSWDSCTSISLSVNKIAGYRDDDRPSLRAISRNHALTNPGALCFTDLSIWPSPSLGITLWFSPCPFRHGVSNKATEVQPCLVLTRSFCMLIAATVYLKHQAKAIYGLILIQTTPFQNWYKLLSSINYSMTRGWNSMICPRFDGHLLT